MSATPHASESDAADERTHPATTGAALLRTDWLDVGRRAVEQVRADHITLTGAGVAFFAFLALVPLLAATLSLYGLLADPAAVGRLVAGLGDTVPDSVKRLIDEQLRTIVAANTGALGVGLVLGLASGLWSASSGFGKLIEGLNIAYGTDDDPRPFWRRRALGLGFTLGAIFVLASSAFAISFVSRIDSPWRWAALLTAWSMVAGLFGFALAIVYRYGPHRPAPSWTWVSPGSVFAVVSWTAASSGFAWYVSSFGSYNEVYGSLGAVIISMLWLYLTTVIVMVGGVLNAEAERDRSS